MPRIPTKEEAEKRKKEYLSENAKKWKIVKRILKEEAEKNKKSFQIIGQIPLKITLQSHLWALYTNKDLTKPLPPLSILPEDLRKRVINEFRELGFINDSAILETREEKELREHYSSLLKKKEPVYAEGEKRLNQLHASKDKRNKYILKHCRKLKKDRKLPYTSAFQLLDSFPDRKDAAEIDGAKVYKEITENGDLKAFCIMPNGKIKPVGLRKFQNYFDEKYKNNKKS
ncbi:MAG: hypothetical protein CVU62_08090 [Deltaproteobacteria bacterium HGW-Deltaproteobacteria-2]|jgi:hypothetical protein|nr:MAG: hypothetical protein CVU62_08090 [Deltaproteobacteria bacterium HGW-Deltaproteobacteria-2]